MKDDSRVLTGYKWVPLDMVSHGHAWEIGKWYHEDGEILPCVRGFHASKTLVDVLEWKESGERLFLVEAKGTIVEGHRKFVASDMRIIVEIHNVDKILRWFVRWSIERAHLHVWTAARDDVIKRHMLEESVETYDAWDLQNSVRMAINVSRARDKDVSIPWIALDAAWVARHLARLTRHASFDKERRVQERMLSGLVFRFGRGDVS